MSSQTTKQFKSNGLSFLRRAISQQKRFNNKFLTIPMSKAEEVVSEANGEFCIPLNPKSNTARAVAFMLGIEVSELCERINGKAPKQYLNQMAELRNHIKSLEVAGDRMGEGNVSEYSRREWVKAKAGLGQ